MSYNFPKTPFIFQIKNVDFLNLQTTFIFNTGAKPFIVTNVVISIESSAGTSSLSTTINLGFTSPDYQDIMSNAATPFPNVNADYLSLPFSGDNITAVPANTDFYFKIISIDTTLTAYNCNVFVEGIYV